MVLITIVTGAYKPIYNWGGPHIEKSMIGYPFGIIGTNIYIGYWIYIINR